MCNNQVEYEDTRVKIHDTTLELLEEYVLIDQTIHTSVLHIPEIKRRLKLISPAFGRISIIFKSKKQSNFEQKKVTNVVHRMKLLKWEWIVHVARRGDIRWSTTTIPERYEMNRKIPRHEMELRKDNSVQNLDSQIKQQTGIRIIVNPVHLRGKYHLLMYSGYHCLYSAISLISNLLYTIEFGVFGF